MTQQKKIIYGKLTSTCIYVYLRISIYKKTNILHTLVIFSINCIYERSFQHLEQSHFAHIDYNYYILWKHASRKISFLTGISKVPGCRRHFVTWHVTHAARGVPRLSNFKKTLWNHRHGHINNISQNVRLPAEFNPVYTPLSLFMFAPYALAVPNYVSFYVQSSLPCPWKCINNIKQYCCKKNQSSQSLGLKN